MQKQYILEIVLKAASRVSWACSAYRNTEYASGKVSLSVLGTDGSKAFRASSDTELYALQVA